LTDATADLNTVSWGDPGAKDTVLLVHGLTGRADAFRARARPNKAFILPLQDARRMQETIPDCALVEVENTNHYDILYSAPKTTVNAVGDLLARA
jgi:hypothetical protein